MAHGRVPVGSTTKKQVVFALCPDRKRVPDDHKGQTDVLQLTEKSTGSVEYREQTGFDLRSPGRTETNRTLVGRCGS